MTEALRAFLGQKKGLAAAVSTLAALVAVIGWHVSDTTLGLCLSPILMYIAGQSHVDAATAKASAPAAQAPVQVTTVEGAKP